MGDFVGWDVIGFCCVGALYFDGERIGGFDGDVNGGFCWMGAIEGCWRS